MRLDKDTFREIGDSLVRNRSRSLLTGFGIFWGLFMLLFLVGGGQGLKELLGKNFEGFASNAIVIFADNTTKAYNGFREDRSWNLTQDDILRLKTLIPELETATGAVSAWGWTAVRNAHTSSIVFKGINADYEKIETPRLKYGRYITEADVMTERKVCVIGKKVYEELFPEGGDPCGQTIKAGPVFLKIVGVDFSTGNININGDASSAVVVPVSYAQRLLNRGKNVDIVCLTAKAGIKSSSLESRIRHIVAREHSFDPTDKGALIFFYLEQFFNMVDTLFRGVNFLVWLVGLGTLLAGAIGVSNIMMVTVKERTVEIGIRRAIGATPSDILSQIMLESVALTVTAGSMGIVFSVLILNLVEMITKGQAAFQINFGTAVLSATLLAVLGMLAGLAPALRAMKIRPVDAMRDE
ncbi:MAG: ABC transporter permease [Bacteroidales bacterium]|nr:ABC transporter permease [Bacteroidales bacterium]